MRTILLKSMIDDRSCEALTAPGVLNVSSPNSRCIPGAIACFASRAAQLSSSNIKGTVTDSTGAIVPSVSVNATSKGTGFSRSSIANDSGQYTISDMPPGLYDVVVERAGFKKFTLTGVRLFVGQTATVDARLEVGQVTESISVTSDTLLIQESSSQVGTVIEGKMLTDIPLNGRNFLQLNLLSPGAIRSKNSNTFDAVADRPDRTKLQRQRAEGRLQCLPARRRIH